MNDKLISLVLIALSLITAITSLRAARLNLKIAKAKDPTTIAMHPRQKTNLISVLILMFICLSAIAFEIYSLSIRTGQTSPVLMWAILGLVVSVFFAGTHAGLYMWADVIVKRLADGELSVIFDNAYLYKNPDLIKKKPSTDKEP